MNTKRCPLPRTYGIGSGAEALYEAESKLSKALGVAAKELGKVLEHDPKDYWTVTLSHALLALLNNNQKEAAVAAAVAFLKENGVACNAIGDPVLGRFGVTQITNDPDSVSVSFRGHNDG